MERHLHGYIDWISKAGKVFFLSLETSELLVSLTGCLSEDFFSVNTLYRGSNVGRRRRGRWKCGCVKKKKS